MLPDAPDSLPPDDARWLQVNVAFAASPDGGNARRLFELLLPQFDAWLQAGRLHAWFFMRKPPGLRLWLCLAAGDAALAEGVDAGIAGLRGPVREHWWSNYAPEVRRFGGTAAIAAVHAYFHADSRLCFELDRLERQGRHPAAATRWLPALFDDLFAAAGSGAERVAAWQQLAALTAPALAADAALPPRLDTFASVIAAAAPEAAALFGRYAEANARLNARLAALAPEGRLERPRPQVLAEVALFGFNRHGFPGSVSAPLVAAALAAALGPAATPDDR